MERVNIARLKLTDNRSISINDPWPSPVLMPDEKGDLKEAAARAVVGAIYFVETTTKSESWVEEEEEEDDDGKVKVTMVTTTESYQVPGHFEVWAFPEEKSFLARTGETRCLRFQREQVLEVEEVWPLSHALEVVKLRRKGTEIPTAEPEGATQPEPTNGAAASPS